MPGLSAFRRQNFGLKNFAKLARPLSDLFAGYHGLSFGR
jgi:hypothetical protein